MIEILVSIAITGVLLFGVATILSNAHSSQINNGALEELQENGHRALDELRRVVRSAGSEGCTTQPAYRNSTVRPTAADVRSNFPDVPVRGFAFTDSEKFFSSPHLASGTASASDLLLIKSARAGARPAQVTDSMQDPESAIAVSPLADALKKTDTALIYTCDAAVYFAVTEYKDGRITHEVTNNTSPSLGYVFRNNASVVAVDATLYYVATSNDRTALWRRVGLSQPQEVASGVEQMKLQFGVDDDGDGVVDTYVTPNAVPDWHAVHSVKIAVLVKSSRPVKNFSVRTYRLLDSTFSPPQDGYARDVFSAVTSVRNSEAFIHASDAL